ncbi:energy-coupling factor ABC transporter ATP-binding protein [Thermocrinis ruber]|uniref:energy-coupling factor ABC transporter ATP-binding protein n=1 Tax=Thermocrinis ruber TaxID=75906 RepID=UPI001FDF52DF|nr:ABC transporter ATP-binding protein [Thermocrinis ruber]
MLKDINLKVEKGERIVVLGINGSGKSTLLKLLNALLFPTKGTYLYKGKNIEKNAFKDKNFIKAFRKEVVLLFQNPDAMIFNPTVYDEIAFGLRQLGFEEKVVKERVLYWAEVFGLTQYLNKPPFILSGGQKQKLCLACLLVLEPEVLLLDEPTANLDPKSTGWLIDFLNELKGVTTITSTHNLSLAPELGNRLIVLREGGSIIYDGEAEAFLKDQEKLINAGLVHKHKDKPYYHLH